MIHLLEGDAFEILSSFEDNCIQCCVTSPPYWGLRTYGHFGEIGNEEDLFDYLAKLQRVCAQIFRVLREDGSFWLNLGDTYVAKDQGTLRKGSLTGVPWGMAFRLMRNGWILRRDIIWQKPNAMPENVKNRCTTAHEYIFHFTKSTKYNYDAVAIRERSLGLGATKIRFGGNKYGDSDDPHFATKSGKEYVDTGFRNKRSIWTMPTAGHRGSHTAPFPLDLPLTCLKATGAPGPVLDPFLGSGTTALAAHALHLDCIGIDLDLTEARKELDGATLKETKCP